MEKRRAKKKMFVTKSNHATLGRAAARRRERLRPTIWGARRYRSRRRANIAWFNLAEVLNQDDVALPTAASADQLLAVTGHVEAEDAVGFEIGHLPGRTPIDGLRPDIG